MGCKRTPKMEQVIVWAWVPPTPMSWSNTVMISGSGAISVSFQARPQVNDASCAPRDNTIAARETPPTTTGRRTVFKYWWSHHLMRGGHNWILQVHLVIPWLLEITCRHHWEQFSLNLPYLGGKKMTFSPQKTFGKYAYYMHSHLRIKCFYV